MTLPTIAFDKQRTTDFARALKAFVASCGGTTTHTNTLDFLAGRLGHRNAASLSAALKGTQAPSNPTSSLPAAEEITGLVVLTNACCECVCDERFSALAQSNQSFGADEFDALGLPYGTIDGEFYPLTLAEQTFIGEDLASSNDTSFLMGYSALWMGRKWLMPTAEICFDGEHWDAPIGRSRDEALQLCERLLAAARIVLAPIGGTAFLNLDEMDRHSLSLLIPFEAAASQATDFDGWKAALEAIIARIEELADDGTGLRAPIHETTFQITVLSHGSYEGHDDNLNQIAYDIDEGNCIGEVRTVSRRVLRPEEVRPRLHSIGNDGCFFDNEDATIRVRAYDIVYFTRGTSDGSEETPTDLPTELVLDILALYRPRDEEIANAISDKTGWLVERFRYELMPN